MSVKNWMMSKMLKMMKLPTCEEVETFSYDFLNQSLDQKTLSDVEKHLRLCKNCQKFIQSYRLVAKDIKPTKPTPLDSEFKDKIFEYLKNKNVKR